MTKSIDQETAVERRSGEAILYQQLGGAGSIPHKGNF
jgi:hypothetical protein